MKAVITETVAHGGGVGGASSGGWVSCSAQHGLDPLGLGRHVRGRARVTMPAIRERDSRAAAAGSGAAASSSSASGTARSSKAQARRGRPLLVVVEGRRTVVSCNVASRGQGEAGSEPGQQHTVRAAGFSGYRRAVARGAEDDCREAPGPLRPAIEVTPLKLACLVPGGPVEPDGAHGRPGGGLRRRPTWTVHRR